jgi:hypothetical protein
MSSKTPSSLKRTPRKTPSHSVRINPQGVHKKIYTPRPNENSWQTADEKREALSSLEDKDRTYVRRPPINIADVNASWKIANEPQHVKVDGKKVEMWQVLKDNKEVLLLTTAAMAGLAAVLSRKSRKGGANKTRKHRK